MGSCQTRTTSTNTSTNNHKPQLTDEQKRKNEEINQIMKNELLPALQQLTASFGPMLEQAKKNQKEKGASQEDLDYLDKVQNQAVPHMEKQLDLVQRQMGEDPEKFEQERLELEKETEQVKEALKRD